MKKFLFFYLEEKPGKSFKTGAEPGSPALSRESCGAGTEAVQEACSLHRLSRSGPQVESGSLISQWGTHFSMNSIGVTGHPSTRSPDSSDTHRHTRDTDAIINTDTQISVHRRTQRHEKYRRTDAVINTDTEKQEQI